MLWKSRSKYRHVLPARGKGEQAVESSNSEQRQALGEDYVLESRAEDQQHTFTWTVSSRDPYHLHSALHWRKSTA